MRTQERKGGVTNTPYDDVFRTLVNDCRSLLIPYVNEMFGESYKGDEEIRFYPNEHLIYQQGGEEKKYSILQRNTKK